MAVIQLLGHLIAMVVLSVGLVSCAGTRERPIQSSIWRSAGVMRPEWEPCP